MLTVVLVETIRKDKKPECVDARDLAILLLPLPPYRSIRDIFSEDVRALFSFARRRHDMGLLCIHYHELH